MGGGRRTKDDRESVAEAASTWNLQRFNVIYDQIRYSNRQRTGGRKGCSSSFTLHDCYTFDLH